MKLNENYILKTVAGSPVVVPVGDAVNDIRGMIKLNDSAEFIWRKIENGAGYEEVLSALCDEYKNAAPDILKRDLDCFLETLRSKKILED
ncbi:MAG: PqqD family protein [Oscillospiraceae bacterium]|nr:PqqD family protein [Oscillospiraceae bacterium]